MSQEEAIEKLNELIEAFEQLNSLFMANIQAFEQKAQSEITGL